MLGRKQEFNLQLNQILDACLIGLAFWLSHALRYYGHDWIFQWTGRPQIPPLDKFFWIVAICAPFTPIVLEHEGYYSNPLQKTPWKSMQQLARSFLWIGFVIGGCVIFLRWKVESRFFLPIFALVSGGVLLAKDAIVRARWKLRVRSEDLRERVILAGTPEAVEDFLDLMPLEQRSLMRVVRRIDISREPVDVLIDCMHDTAAERVIFATAHTYFDRIEEAIRACETEGVEAWLAADFFQTSIAKPDFDVLAGRPMIVFRSVSDASWALLFKDFMDRVGALALIVVTSPFWLAAYVGIKISAPGPAFFKQERSGRFGHPFTMFKFRTMVVDAEEKREELEAENQMSGPVFKIEQDPRIFRFGRLLRRLSIDELPQLLNVLAGHMSLVGPRPLPVYEIRKIEVAAQRRRLSVKPGLTCLWQVSGRNRITSFEDWVALDLKYIDNWSIWLDFVILLRTIPAVILGSGAR